MAAIRYDLQGDGVGLITFDRPAQLNTFTAEMMTELGALYRQADGDDRVRALVVTGAGRAFCAGADLGGGAETFDRQDLPDFSSCPLEFQAWQVRKPVIAACNGHAIGVGLGIATQCDLRIFAEQGKYGYLQVRRGVIPDFAIHHLLPRIIGLENALDLVLTGRTLSGMEAHALGLCGRVVAADRVLPVALELAAGIAGSASPLAVGLAKRLLWQGMDLGLPGMERRETRWLEHTMGRPDALEGGLAYVEKRPPRWQSSVLRDWPEDDPSGAG